MQSLLFPFLNLAALVALIVWKTKGPFVVFMAARRKTVEDELKRTAAALAEATSKQKEFDARLKGLAVEIEALRSQSRRDAEAKGLQILTEAKRLGDQIVSDARMAGDQMVVDFRAQLVAETAHQVIGRAERALKARLTGDDRVRFNREFSSQLEHHS
jgi:F0F1-type ATP synthase membrane subunit b/b'